MIRRGSARADRSRRALLVALGVDNLGSGLFLPLALVYATRVVGLDVTVAGPAVAVAGLVGFGVPPVAGRLSHRFGPRRVVVASQLLQAVGAAAYLLAGNVGGVLLAAALMAGGMQLFYCSVFVLVADASPGESAERPFARVAMVRAGAFGLGNLVAAVTLATGGTGGLPWLVAADALTFVLAAGLLATYVETEPVPHDVPAVGALAVLRDGRYRLLIAATALVVLSLDIALIGTPVFVLDALDGPAWLPGALLATSTALSSVLGVRVVEALRPFRRTRSMQAGSAVFVVWALLMSALVLVPRGALVPVAFAVWLLVVAGNKVFYPVAGALSEALPPRASRAGYMATYQYAFTTSQAVAPAVVALFAVRSWLPWSVGAVAAMVGIGLQARLGRQLPEHLNRRAP